MMMNKKLIEAKILANYKEHQTFSYNKKLRLLLLQRKSVLYNCFEANPEQLKELNAMNAKLQKSTKDVLGKLLSIYNLFELTINKDGFTQDYELEGRVGVNVDEFYDLEPLDILAIIDSVTYSKDLVYSIKENNQAYLSRQFIVKLGRHRVDFYCCRAMYNLLEYSLFALEDIVRISSSNNYTWNEVVVQYQNFGNQPISMGE